MADTTITVIKHSGTGQIEATLSVVSVEVAEKAGVFNDTLSFTASGIVPVDYGDTVTITMTDNRQTPAVTKNFGTFEISDYSYNRFPDTTTLKGAKIFDDVAFVRAFTDALTARAPRTWFPVNGAFYPFQDRWESIIHPSTAIDTAPHFLEILKDRILDGGVPTFRKLRQVLMEYALDLFRAGDSTPMGAFNFDYDGDTYILVPINYTSGIGAYADTDIAVQTIRENTQEIGDNYLDRQIEFSVPVQAGLPTDVVASEQTIITYTGGTKGPKVVIGNSFINPYEGVIALEGERLRRYFTNRSISFTTAFHLDAVLPRASLTLPTSVSSAAWRVEEVVYRFSQTEASVGYTLLWNGSASGFETHSPSPFNGVWPAAYTLPSAPIIEIIEVNAQGEIQVLPDDPDGLPTRVSTGSGFVVRFSLGPSDAPKQPKIIRTLVSVRQGKAVRKTDTLEGEASTYIFLEGIAGELYTVEITFVNSFGTGPTRSKDIRLGVGERPEIILGGDPIPQIMFQQLHAVPDGQYDAYIRTVQELSTPVVFESSLVNTFLRAAGVPAAILAVTGGATLLGFLVAGGAVAGSLAASAIAIGVGGYAMAIGVVSGGLNILLFGPGQALSLIFAWSSVVPIVGTVIAVVTGLILGFLQVRGADRRHGTVVQAIAWGKGYRIKKVRVQHRKRRPGTPFSTWADQPLTGGSDLQVSHLNPVGTTSSILLAGDFSDTEIRDWQTNTEEGQYRIAAITSVNEGIQDDDAALQTNGDWTYTRVWRYRDYFHLWADAYFTEDDPNAPPDDPDRQRAVVRNRPTFIDVDSSTGDPT